MKKLTKFVKENILIILAVIYLIWPIDFIPELFTFWSGPIPFLDDIGLLTTAIILRIISFLRTDQPQVENPEDISDKQDNI